MNNRYKLKKVIDKDFDKEKNYNNIQNKLNNNNKYIKYSLSFVCLIFVLFTMFIINKNNTLTMHKEAIIEEIEPKTNINTYSTSDYDVNTTNNSNHNNVCIPYFEVLNNLSIPSDFDIKYEGRARVKILDKNDKDYGKINNYEFVFKNSKNSRNIVISISDKNEPINNIKINLNKSSKSIINNVELIIYKDKNIFVCKFKYKEYNFLIETTDITQDEFNNLLESLIK